MKPGGWRVAYASAAGTSHAQTATPCQDAGYCETVLAGDGAEILLASVSDGAGSASRAAEGARLVVDAFHRVVGAAVREQGGLGLLDCERMRAWLAGVQAEIARLAAENGLQASDYAATFLGAVIGSETAVFAQIGDGAIVLGKPDGGEAGHEWVFWPQHGEFANSTCFVTMEDAGELLQFHRRDAAQGTVQVCEVALFSDGLERLILDMTARTVHSPSLAPIFRWLASTPPEDGNQPSEVLLAYLNSAKVNRRTDDDKTLVLAVRALPAGPV